VVKEAAANMWIGVSQAGYSFREEFPIFLLMFLLPSAAAIFVKWKFFEREWILHGKESA
jgi:hypothetical protein